MKLVLLPGMDGTGRLFADFVSALGNQFDARVVSYPRGEPLQYAELEEFARSVNDDAGPFVLVAESFSTPIAIRWASSAPQDMKALVLCAGFARSPLNGVARLMALALGPILLRWNPPDFVLQKLLFGRRVDSSLLAGVRAALADVEPGVLGKRLRSVLTCDERANLQRLTLPILLIRPTRDRLVPTSAYEQIQAVNPIVKVKTVDGPHLILQTKPAECAEIISAFVETNS